MNTEEYRAFLDLLMVTDPWPDELIGAYSQTLLKNVANRFAIDHGYSDWIAAYHLVK